MNKTNGFERRTLAKKKIILEAAHKLFFEKGPSQTAIAEIAKEAGVSQVSIYNYFGSKDNLLEIIIREHLELSLKKAEDIFDKEIPFTEKLNQLFSLGKLSENDIDDDILKNFNWEDKRIQAIYYDFVMERQTPFLLRFIEMGKAEGVIQKDLSNEAIIAFLNANMAIYKDEDFLKKGKNYLSSLSHLFYFGLIGK